MSTEPNLESKKDWKEIFKEKIQNEEFTCAAGATDLYDDCDPEEWLDEDKLIKFIEDLLADKEREFVNKLDILLLEKGEGTFHWSTIRKMMNSKIQELKDQYLSANKD